MPQFGLTYDVYDYGKNPLLGAVYDRPELALRALMLGRLGDAGRAIFAPEQVAPDTRKTFGGRGEEKAGLLGRVAGTALDVATNPLLLLGLVLTAKYGKMAGPAVEGLLSYTGKRAEPLINPLTQLIGSVSERYRGSPLPMLFEAHMERLLDWTKKLHGIAIKEGEGGFRDAVGRPLTEVERLQLANELGAFNNPEKSLFWKRFKKRLESTRKLFIKKGDMEEVAKLDEDLRLLEDSTLFKPSTGTASPAIQALADKYRQVFQTVLAEIRANPEHWESYKASAQRAGIKLGDTPLMATHYWPEMPLPGKGGAGAMDETHLDALLQTNLNRLVEGSELQELAQSPLQFGRFKMRTGRHIPDPAQMRKLGYPEELVQLLERRTMTYKTGARAGQPMLFSLDAPDVVRRYSSSAARTIAAVVPEAADDYLKMHPDVAAKIQALRAAGKPGHIPGYAELEAREALLFMQKGKPERAREVLRDMKLVSGIPTDLQLRNDQRWRGMMDYAKSAWAPGGSGRKLLGDSVADWMAKGLENPALGSRRGPKAIAEWIYLSTLAAPNLVPGFFNSFQGIVNSYGWGPKYFYPALRQTLREMRSVWTELRSGKTLTEAVEKVNPELYKASLELMPGDVEDPLTEMLRRADTTFAGKAGTLWQHAKEKMMLPFSLTELWNRMLSFNTATRKLTAEALGKKFYFPEVDASWVVTDWENPRFLKWRRSTARQLTMSTQFGGGPLEAPGMLADWPAPLRQFTQFPLRQLGLITGPMLRNPAYGARALAMTGLTYSMLKHGMDWDTSRGLLFGGVPLPQEDGAFAPMPLVPPAVQILGAAGMSLAKGDATDLLRTLPLLVPGGVGMARLAQGMPGVGAAAGAVTGRPHVDYSQQTPDGRFALYNSKEALVGYYTPVQILAKASGLGDIGGEQERRLYAWLQKQAPYIHDLKRKFLDAVYANDTTTMARMQEQWTRMFPGAGAIPVRPAEVNAVQTRKHVSRLERALQGLPVQARAEIAPAIAVALGANYPAMLGLQAPPGADIMGGDAALLSKTMQERDQYRAFPRGSVASQMPGSRGGRGLHGVKMRDKVSNLNSDAAEAWKPRNIYPVAEEQQGF